MFPRTHLQLTIDTSLESMVSLRIKIFISLNLSQSHWACEEMRLAASTEGDKIINICSRDKQLSHEGYAERYFDRRLIVVGVIRT